MKQAVRSAITRTVLAIFMCMNAGCMSDNEGDKVYQCEEWQRIHPGRTSQAELVDVVGIPSEIHREGQAEWYIYPSENKLIPHVVSILQDTVAFVGVHCAQGDQKLDTILGRYGEPQKIAYSTFAPGTRLYVFPEHGMAFVIEEDSRDVLYYEKFEPTSLDEYIR